VCNNHVMRWAVLALLLAVTSINYLDRLLFSVLSPVLRDEFHFDERLYGNVTAAFQVCYAVGFLALGPMLDRLGTKLGLAIAAFVWTLASLMHSTVSGAAQFGVWRGLLGFSEGANFPACNKALAEWFPKHERALAAGILNAGPNIASVIGPPLFVTLTASYGWRACFVAVSLVGFLWVAVWMWLYRPQSQPASGIQTPKISFSQVLRYRPARGYILGKILVDPTFFFLLYWLPLYFRDVRKLEMSQIGWALPCVYFASGVGSVTAGWASSKMLQAQWSTRRARLTVMGLCAVVVPIAITGALGGGTVQTVVMFSLAAAAHQAFSSMAYTIPGDVFPSNILGTVFGWGGFAGSISSVIFSALLPGLLVPIFGYTPLLITLSFGYLVAVMVTARTFGDFQPVDA
jgi:MFS transporter, ACS family, hexuronate transporter